MAIAAIRITASAASGALEAFRKRTQEQILAAGGVIAEEMEQTAKRDAPWTDRTGRARRTMEGINTIFEDGAYGAERYGIGVCGRMSYSPELERGHGYRYSVLVPTLRKYQDTALERIRAVISRQEAGRFG